MALAAALAVAGVMALPNQSQAVTDTWNGTGAVWNTTADWTSAIPTAADTALFNGTGTINAVTLSGNGNALNLNFDQGTSYTIGTTGSSYSLTLAGGGYVQMLATDTVSQTINEPLVLGGNYSFLNNSTTSAATLTIGGTIGGTGTDDLTLGGTNTGTQLISGAIGNGTGTVSLNVTGSNWNLSGANTYSGGTTISGGTLDLTGALSTSDSLAVNGGTFELDNGGQTVATLSGGSSTIDLVSGTLTVTNGNTYSGVIEGAGGLTLNGGAMTLSGTNSYTGGTTVNAGTLLLTGSLGTGNMSIDYPGIFNLNNTSGGATIEALSGNGILYLTADNTLTVDTGGTFSGTILGSGGLTVNVNTLSLTGNGELGSYTGLTTIENNGTLDIAMASDLPGTDAFTYINGGFLGLTGTPSQTLGIITLGGTDTIDGGGASNGITLGNVLSGSSSNVLITQDGIFDFSGTVSGALTVNGSTVSISSANALTSYTGPTTIENGGTLTIAYGTGLPSTSAFIFSNSGNLNFSGGTGTTQTIGAVTLGGTDVVDAGGATNTLTLGGTISSNTSGNTLILQNGVFDLTGPATSTNFIAGVLQIGGGAAGLAATANFVGASTLPGGSATLVLDDGTFQYGANGMNVSNDISLTAGTSDTIDINNRTGAIYSGNLSGSGSLTLENSAITNPSILAAGAGGTLTLEGSNSSFSGDVSIYSNLTVRFTTDSAFGSGEVVMVNNDVLQFGAANLVFDNQLALSSAMAGVIDVAGTTGTDSGQITSVGPLTVNNSSSTAGELILTNTSNNYSGGTIIDDGTSAGHVTLALESGGVLPTGDVTIGSEGELLLANASTFSQTIGLLTSISTTSNVTLDTGNTLQVDVGGSFAGSLNGGGDLTVDGAAGDTFTLTGALAGYTGLTTIQDNGTLDIHSASGVTSTNNLAFTFVTGTNELILGPGQTIGQVALGGTDTINGSGAAALDPVTLGGSITGSGTESLELANGHFAVTNFNNGTDFSAGTLQIGDGTDATVAQFLGSPTGSQNALPGTNVAITLENGTFQFGGSAINVTNAMTVDSTNGIIDINGQTGAEVIGDMTITGALTLENSALGGGGMLTLAGDNTGAGPVTIDNGLTVNFQNTTSDTSNFGTGTVTLAAAGDTLQYGAGSIILGNDITVGAASFIDLNGQSGSEYSGALTGSSNLTLENSDATHGDNTLTITSSSDNAGFGGTIAINNGMTVNFQSTTSSTSNFGTGTVKLAAAGDTLQFGVNGMTLSNAIAVNANSNIDIDTTNTTTVDALTGDLSGSASLTLENSTISGTVAQGAGGLLALDGSNSAFIGDTNIATSGLTVSFTQNSAFGTGGTVALNAANDTLQFGGSVAIANALNLNSTGGTIDVNATSDIWSGVISGNDLTVINSSTTTAGELTLTNTNTYSGGTTIGVASGEATTTLAVSGTGTGTVGGGLLTVNATGVFNMNAGTVNQTVAGLVGSGSVALGSNTLALNLPSGASDTFSGVISSSTNGSLTVKGSGTEILTGANTYNGTTNITGNAALDLTGFGSIADSSSVNLNSGGAVFDISATTPITIEGTSIVSLAGVTGSNVNLGSKTLTITDGAGTFGGAINGTGSLAISGGTETLTGANTFTGGTLIGSTSGTNATLILGTGGSLAQGSNLTFGTGGDVTFTLDSGLTQNIGVLNGGNNINALINIDTGSTLVVADGVNFAGNIDGLGGLVVNGGTLNLSGDSSFSGGTLLDNASTTVVGSSNALGTGLVTIGTGGATIQFGGAGAWNLANAVAISGINTLTFDTNGLSDTWSGAISGTGSLDVINSSIATAGTLILTGTNSYSGGTTIGAASGEDVTLTVTGTGTIGTGLLTINATGIFNMSGGIGQTVAGLAGSGNVDVGSNTLTLNLPTAANDSYAGVISGTNGSLTVEGSGTQTLTGTNTYTGATTIDGNATLALSGANDVIAASSGVNLATAGAIFKISGVTTTQNIGSLNGVTGTSIVLSTTSAAALQINGGGIFSGSISGANGGLIVDGTNHLALTLNGSLSNYTGLTTIQNGGTLNISYADNLPGTDAFTFINSGTLNFTDPNSQTIGAVTVGGTDTIDAGGAGNVLTIAGNITSNNGTGTNNLLILQNGTIDVNGADNSTDFLTGTLQIGNGTGNSSSALARFNSAVALPATAVGITLADGTFQYGDNNINVTNAVTVSASGVIDIDGTSGSQIHGNLSGTSSLTLENSNTATGNNTLILSGDNGAAGGSFTGNVTIDSGLTVNFQNTGDNPNGNFGTGSIALAAAGDTLQFGADGITLGSNTTNAIAVNADSYIDIDGHTGANISGNLSGSANLTLENSTISGTVNQGAGGSLAIDGANSAFGGNTFLTTSGLTVSFTQSSAFGTGGTVNFNAANDAMQYNAGVAINNALALNSTGGTIDTNGNTGTWSGPISGNDLTVRNSNSTPSTPGTLTLTHINTYTGGTTIGSSTDTNSTTLAVTGTGTIGSGLLTLANPGNTSTVAETFDMSGGTVNQTVAGLVSTNKAAVVNLGANTLTLNLPSGAANTYSGSINDGGLSGGTGGSLIVTGAGSETLSGASTYTGDTTVDSGATLTVTGTIYGGSSRGNVVADGDVIFNNGTTTTIDMLSGTGTLNLENVGSSITTLAVTGSASGTAAGLTSTFGGTLLGNGTLEADNSILDLTGNVHNFTGHYTATSTGNIVFDTSSVLASTASLNVTNDHSITLAYGNLAGNAVNFSGNSSTTPGYLYVTHVAGGATTATLGSVTNAISILDTGVGTTNNIIDGGGSTNTLFLDGALTSNNTTGTNDLQLENGNFVLANTSNSTDFVGNGNLQIGDGADATIAQFSSASNLPAASVGITLDLGELAYTGSTAATVSNNITDVAGTNNLIDAGTQQLTLGTSANSITNTSGILTLQNGTFVLGGTNDVLFSGGSLELGNGGSDTSTIVDFASAANLPAIGANLLLNGATLAYTGGATNPVTVVNAITIGDAPTTNIIDAGGATETLSGQLTDTDGSTLILQDGTVVLDNTSNSSTFTTGTLQIGNTGVTTSIAQFAAAGDLPAAAVEITFDNGELQYQGAVATAVTVSNNLSLIADGIVDGGGNTGLVSLVGELMNTNAANTLTLQNGIFNLDSSGDTANNNTTFTAGTLAIGNGTGTTASALVKFAKASDLPGINAAILLDNGTLAYTGTGSSAVVNAIDVTGIGNGVVDAGTKTLTLSGALTDNSNTLTLQNGNIILSNASNSTDFVGGNLQIGNGSETTVVSAASASDLPSGTVGDVVGITLDDGTLQQTAGYTVANTLTLTSNSTTDTLDVDGNIGTYTGVISDSGTGTLATLDLTSSVVGSGTVILNGVNTYAGATNVLNGVTAVAGNDVAGISNAFGAGATTDVLTISGTNSTVDSINAYKLTQNTLLNTAIGETIELGAYTQDVGTNLNLVAFGRPVVGQPTSGTYDALNANAGVVNLAGTLNLAFSSVSDAAFTHPADFDTYKIITTSSTTNTGVNASGGISPTAVGATPIETAAGVGGNTYGIGWLSVNPGVTNPNYNSDLNYYENSPTGNSGNQIVAIQTLFLPDAQTPNEQAIAQYIDQNITPFNNVPPALQNALADLSLLTPAQIAQILNGLTPQAYSGLADEAFQNSTFLNQEVFEQTQNAFDSTGFNTSGLTMLNTKDQNPFAISLESQMKSAQQQAANSLAFMDNDDAMSSDSGYADGSGFNGFVLGTVTFNQQANNGSYSQKDTTGGILGGLDYRLNRNLVIGGLFNWNYTGGTLDNLNSGQQVSSYTPGLFAGYRKDNFYADALVSYTYNTYRINRNIPIPGAASVATGEPTANQYDAGILMGYNLIASDGLKFGPAGGVGFTQMNISGFNETGSPFDLSVSKQHADSLRTLLGGQGTYTMKMHNLPLPVSFNFDAFWQHECLDSARGITSSFSQVSGGQFLFNTPGPSRDSALLGVGTSGYIARGVSLFVNYQTQIGQHSQYAQTVMAGVAVKF